MVRTSCVICNERCDAKTSNGNSKMRNKMCSSCEHKFRNLSRCVCHKPSFLNSDNCVTSFYCGRCYYANTINYIQECLSANIQMSPDGFSQYVKCKMSLPSSEGREKKRLQDEIKQLRDKNAILVQENEQLVDAVETFQKENEALKETMVSMAKTSMETVLGRAKRSRYEPQPPVFEPVPPYVPYEPPSADMTAYVDKLLAEYEENLMRKIL